MLVSEKIKSDLTNAELADYAVAHESAVISATGAIVVNTGARTGRSPADRFIVRDDMTIETVDWGKVNQPIEQAVFSALWSRAEAYLNTTSFFQSSLQVGADSEYALPLTVKTEYAWHHLFCRHLFISSQNASQQAEQSWTLVCAPGLATSPERDGVNSDGTVIINLSEKKVLVCGIAYAGEMKKAMFTAMNYFLPERHVLPMHCAANQGESGDVALFFGLSGTGKTTLSADPSRYLIGDDEHGWGSNGVFNFEGGCYAKCINLSEKREPMIWSAIRTGAIMENVVLQDDGRPDFDDDRYTQNTRCAYPRDFIDKKVESNAGGQPSAVIFLTCDLYGVLPPVSLLTKEQAAYYFLSGYTALVGSTEVGAAPGVKPTFSTCFGAPFFPRRATVYADLLMERVVATGAQVYLVNTGWTGAAFGQGGQRFDIPVTRRVVAAAISGELVESTLAQYPGFDFQIPVAVEGVDSALLNPSELWRDHGNYKATVNQLISQFQTNFTQFEVSEAVRSAGPERL